MPEKNFDLRYANTPDSRVPILGKTRKHIIDIAKAFFRTCYRNVELNRVDWCFNVSVVNADEASVKQFSSEYPMCFVENTFTRPARNGKVKINRRRKPALA